MTFVEYTSEYCSEYEGDILLLHFPNMGGSGFKTQKDIFDELLKQAKGLESSLKMFSANCGISEQLKTVKDRLLQYVDFDPRKPQ